MEATMATASEATERTCDKCPTPVDTQGGWHGVACMACGASYIRCEAHGGQAGARRSLHSHRALMHPKAVR
jgi:hypothetical protein